MDILQKLERRFGWLAVPGLVRAVVVLNGLVYLLVIFNPGYVAALTLDPAKVVQGEVWRLVSYIFIPPPAHPIFILFALWFLWMLGDGLEQAWGSFRLTLFYLLGMVGTTVAAFLTGGATTNAFLNISLLFAFATFYPNYTILLFLILPVKIKWVAWFSLAMMVFSLLGGSWAFRLAILVSLTNYLIFFGPVFLRHQHERRKTAVRKAKFDDGKRPENEPLHTCATCGANDLANPDLEFRVAADGLDYCENCLKNPPFGSSEET